MTYAIASLDEIERIPLSADGPLFRPVRHALGVTAIGVNAYTAEAVGVELIEPHDETSAGAGGHEELYFVVSGRAAFTVGEEEVDAAAGTLVLVPVGVNRAATAVEAATTVLVLGGPPRAALPASPFEHWYRAAGAYQAGDYDRAAAIASEGLRDHPDHPSLNYQLACYYALGGRREEALHHLGIAFAQNPQTREWAAGDSDLDSIRDAL